MNAKQLISLVLICSFSFAAQAGHKGNYPHNKSQKNRYNNHHGQFYDYAHVSSVKPIIETIEHRVPQQCNHRSSHYNTNYNNKRSATPMIIGTIIGAAIGNELGHKKSNQRVGAAVGGILGGSIGYDISNKHRVNTTSRHRCDDYAIEYEERVVGYDVSYRYRGMTYQTTTREHPGRKIQLKLKFEPIIS
jgi:uncharacterized protein YcfJ